MAYGFHVTIEGAKQGKLMGESTLQGQEGKLLGKERLKSALFELRRTDATGREVVYQTIKLTNATQGIEIESRLRKTMATDSWSGGA